MLLLEFTSDQLIDSIKKLDVSKTETLLLLVGEETSINLEKLIPKINELNISFFGGIFPGIISGTENYKQGCILKKLPVHSAPILIKDLGEGTITIPEILEEGYQESNTCLLTFIDGLSGNISRYLQQLYHSYGNRIKIMGGGAGSLSLVQQPCVFSNEGIFQNAAVLCPIKMEISLGVKHGWEKLHGPVVATRTKANVIHELNWKNALEVYKDTVEHDSWKKINTENFFEIAKGYPFGIARENGEDIVRDPIKITEKGALVCVGDVPENTVLYILKGKNESLIQSAQSAITSSIKNVTSKIQHTLIVDCISRTLFLEDEFHKELEAINNAIHKANEGSTPQGVLSLGEISSNGEGFLEFYNKTLVVGTLSA